MAEEKISKIEQKKRELEAELARIQTDIDGSIDNVKEDVTHNLSPVNLIKKYPLPVVGASVVVGFLLGSERKAPRSASHKGERNLGISREVKRILAKKGLNMLMDYLDQKIHELKNEQQQ